MLNRSSQDTRLHEIDGFRGWAAISVLLFHLAWETFGALHPGIRSFWSRFFLDGQLAVCVFFILSGDALSAPLTGGSMVSPSAASILKRYFRLAGPVLLSSILAYALMASSLVFSREAAILVGRKDWLGNFLQFEHSLPRAIQFGLITAFSETSPDKSYNQFLWTMGIELVGSMMIFCFGSISKKIRNEKTILAVIFIYLAALGSYYALFFIGMLFGHIRAAGLFETIRRWRPNRLFMLLSLTLIWAMDGSTELLQFRPRQMMIAMAASLVFTCYASTDLCRMARNSTSRFIGRISFSLYVVHFSIIASFTSYLIVLYGNSLSSDRVTLAIISGSTLVCFVSAYFVSRIESTYMKCLDRSCRSILKSSKE